MFLHNQLFIHNNALIMYIICIIIIIMYYILRIMFNCYLIIIVSIDMLSIILHDTCIHNSNVRDI